MIGRLTGTLVYKRPPTLMIDVAGVGYELEAPLSVFFDLPAVGESLQLLTHLQVKEDAHTLYGFASDAQRDLFRSLLKVSGVGAKLALAILSGVTVPEFAALINSGDAAALTRLPGIGKKTAERLVVEMRDRIAGLGDDHVLPAKGVGGGPRDAAAEASEALRQLGYKPAEVSRMVSAVADDGVSAEELIRLALKSQVRS